MKSVEEILAQAQALLAMPVAKIEYLIPNRLFHGWEVLCPNNYEIQDQILHIWSPERAIPDDLHKYPENVTVVVHSHVKGDKCFASYYCFIRGYEPTGAEHPDFGKQFRIRWTPNLKPLGTISLDFS